MVPIQRETYRSVEDNRTPKCKYSSLWPSDTTLKETQASQHIEPGKQMATCGRVKLDPCLSFSLLAIPLTERINILHVQKKTHKKRVKKTNEPNLKKKKNGLGI